MTVGTIIAFSGTREPNGYLICDGRGVSTTEYEDLFNVIGYAFGGAGATFNLPDMRARTVIGVNDTTLNNGEDPGAGDHTGLSTRNLSDNGGAETHQLTIPELPSHTHQYNLPGTSQDDKSQTLNNAEPVAGNTDDAGGDQPHNNMQPFTVMHWVIKY